MSLKDRPLVNPRQASRRQPNTALEAFEKYFSKADVMLTPAAYELTDDDVVGMVKKSK